MAAVVVIAHRQMQRRERAKWHNQSAERLILARGALLESQIAVDDDGGGTGRPRKQFLHARLEVGGHVHGIVKLRRIGRDVRIGKKCEKVFVPRFAEPSGIAARCNRRGRGRERRAFEKLTARKLG